MAFGYPPLFKGTLTHPTTQYIGVPTGDVSLIGLYIARTDTSAAATITLEMTEFGAIDAPVDTAGTYQWKDTGEVITDPAVPGAVLVHLGNIGTSRSRLKIVTAATASFEIYARRKLSGP